MDEDCLELNVYTPAADGAKRPVMVWIYGGGFVIGSAATYDASSLALRGDVVVVTVNYRIGALGFSYLEHLDERFAGSGNAGIRDQIASLVWVRDNIAAFGGDPGCVTIFGESAGGHSVGCLLTSPEAQGLFHRAIAESSAGWGLRAREWGEDVTAKVMAEVGATSVEALQAAGVDAILAAQAGLANRPPGGVSGREGPRSRGTGATPFAPTLDGVVLNGAVIDEVAAGRAASVPLLIFHTRDELKSFGAMGRLPDLGDEDGLASWIAEVLPDGHVAVEAYRNAEPDGSLTDWLSSFLTDQNIHMPDFRMADVRVATTHVCGWRGCRGSHPPRTASSVRATDSRSRSCSGARARPAATSEITRRLSSWPTPSRTHGLRSPGPATRTAPVCRHGRVTTLASGR